MYLQSEHKVWLATGEGPVYLEPGMANRHGLIAGATGTGKTVTLKVLAEAGEESAAVTIQGHHTNITDIEKNGEVLFHVDYVNETSAQRIGDRSQLTVRAILEFADAVDVEQIAPILQQQIDCNYRIAQEGMSTGYGAGVAHALLDAKQPSAYDRARAMAAAASEAVTVSFQPILPLSIASITRSIVITLVTLAGCRASWAFCS